MIFSADANTIIIAGTVIVDDNESYQAGIYGINGNDPKMRFGFVDNVENNYMRITNIANLISGTSNIVWGCGDKSTSTFVVASLTFSGASNPSSGWFGTTASSITCRGIGKVTSNQAYVLASSSTE